MNSLLDPSAIERNQCAYLENTMIRGGIVQTRPGYILKSTIQGTNLQGMAIFEPISGVPKMMVAVDGGIYVSQFPYTSFTQLSGLSFSPTVKFIHFQQCLRSSKTNADGSITLLNPRSVMIIQDGISQAAYWDGNESRHLDPTVPASETPIGTWMAWVSSRLWVASNNRIYASNLTDPLTFTETTYLAERSSFELGAPCTGLLPTSNRANLLAFTDENTFVFKSSIYNRTEWATTRDFQDLLVPGIGCVAGRSAINHFGESMWFSQQGWISLDVAMNSENSSRLVTLDQEMMRSKRNLSPDLERICALGFENLLMVSVPCSDLYNSHTWVMDQSPIGGDKSAWAGVWTGTRPAQWAKTKIGGRKRAYFASFGSRAFDATQIHIWEAFRDNRKDNGGRIKCQMETGLTIGKDKSAFRFLEIDVCELVGPVRLQGFVGGVRGPYHQILDVELRAENGCFGSPLQPVIESDSVIEAYKPQKRIVVSKQFSPQDIGCTPESEDPAGVDRGFQVLLEWHGRMGVSGIKVMIDADKNNPSSGKCQASEEGEINAISETGEEVEEQ